MPTENSSNLLEWNEDNAAKVVADLYREARSDQDLHKRLMTEPFDVLKSRIDIPDGFRGGVFSREKNLQTMMLYVPAYGGAQEALPTGTSEETSRPDLEILCTAVPPW